MQTLATKWNLERYDLGSPLNWLITPQMVKEALKPKLIEATTKSDQQNSFSGWIDHVLRHRDGDTALVLGRWTLLRTNEDDPYLISDSPLISFSRGKAGLISWGDGFNKPTVEVILPISPTACLHVVPAQNKVDYVLPTTEEVNWLQALFVHESGYCNKYSQRLEELVGAYAETAQIGINCYVVNPESYRYYFLETMLKCSSKKAISPLARPLNLFFRATARA